ncbi:tetratricopeptide repeat protein [Fangia hongkongensis]|uniref:tetratricopeptide repeat protein n=1 Tax=Fangia hongkongensis TaxID=270495 RepID=UPI00035D3111|nr:tetratricopeptide repeat protein [Fangia hongkongensis]
MRLNGKRLRQCKYALIALGAMSINSLYAANVDDLSLEVTKLQNQVSYLIAQQNQAKSNQFAQTLDQLRGQIEMNSYKLAQLNQTVSQTLVDFSKRLDALEKKVNKPSARELRLQRDNAAFEKAKSALLAKNYNTAKRLFNNYTRDYYNGENYSESLYLLGQIYLIQGDTKAAYQKFNTIVTRYPKSVKIIDATYSLAVLELANGNKAKAKRYFQQIVSKYPSSSYAKKADMQLKKLN